MYNSHFPIKLGAYSLLRKIWVTTQMIGDGLNETQFIGSGAIDITFVGLEYNYGNSTFYRK